MKIAKIITKNNTVKRAGVGLALAFLTSSSVFAGDLASDKKLAGMHKQLAIMNNIIKSSVKVQGGKNTNKLSSIESIYLKGQGALFTIYSRNINGLGRHHFSFVMPTPPVAPVAPIADTDTSFAFTLHDSDENVAIEFESNQQEYERAIEILEESREVARGVRNEQRDIAYEIRDIARETKDFEYQLRHADKETKKKLKAKVEKLEKEKKLLVQSKAQLDKKVQQLNEQQQKQKMIQAQERKAYFKALSSALVDTLCLYGNGLKAVPRTEHVSLIIKSAGEKAGRRYKDEVYVFTKKDINDCSSDKINSEKLLAKAEKYQF